MYQSISSTLRVDWWLTLTRASVKFVHIAISSRVLMSGYRFRLNVCSNSCNCCDVKWVLWRRCLLFFLSFFGSSVVIESSAFSCLTCVSFRREAVEMKRKKKIRACSSGEISFLISFKKRQTQRERRDSTWNMIFYENYSDWNDRQVHLRSAASCEYFISILSLNAIKLACLFATTFRDKRNGFVNCKVVSDLYQCHTSIQGFYRYCFHCVGLIKYWGPSRKFLFLWVENKI